MTEQPRHKSAPVSIRLPPELNQQLAALAASLDRSKSWVIEQAIRDYVSLQAGQSAAIEEGIGAADAGRVAPHEDVLTWVRSWGTPGELPPPKCG